MEPRKLYLESLEEKLDEGIQALSSSIIEALRIEAQRMSSGNNSLDPQAYLQFLYLLYLASQKEQSTLRDTDWVENAISHAKKLLQTFGSLEAAKRYLNRADKVNESRTKKRTNQLVHDASLFSLPESSNWNSTIWQKIINEAKPNGPEDEIMRLLPIADLIERYIADPQNRVAIEQIITEDVEASFKKKNEKNYKNDFADIKIKNILEDDWVAVELKKLNKKSKKNSKEHNPDQEKLLRQAYKNEESYITYRVKQESFLKSTVKSKLDTVIPFSEKTPVPYLKKISNNLIYKRANENPEAAALFFMHRISEEKFNLYLSLKPNHSNEFIPDVEIKGETIHESYKNYIISKLDAANPEAAILGKLTSCCQWFGGQGEPCAIHGITDPRGGFYVLRDQTTKEIIAQCWAWYSAEGNIVFDSIEIKLNSREKHKTMVNDFFISLANLLTNNKHVPVVLLGAGGATPGEMKLLRPFENNHLVDYEGYCDSREQVIISQVNLPITLLYLQQNPDSKLKTSPVNLDKEQSIIWCDLLLNSFRDPKLESLKLSPEAEERTNLTIEWLKKMDQLQEPEVWAELQSIVDKVNISQKNFHGLTALDYAIKAQNFEIMKNLIEKGASVDAKQLHVAARVGNLDIIKYLIEKGLDPNKKEVGSTETILQSAAASGNLKVVKYFLDHGANIFDKDHQNYTVIQYAISNYYTNDSGRAEDVDLAIRKSCLQLVNYLLSYATERNEFVQFVLESSKSFIDFLRIFDKNQRLPFLNSLGKENLQNIIEKENILESLIKLFSADEQTKLLTMLDPLFVRKLISNGVLSEILGALQDEQQSLLIKTLLMLLRILNGLIMKKMNYFAAINSINILKTMIWLE